jgi:hypothetical protein
LNEERFREFFHGNSIAFQGNIGRKSVELKVLWRNFTSLKEILGKL